jgi:DNA repair exonuclease SbcCD nuclease subunit
MGIRFLHTGDVHIGASFVGLGDRGSVQRSQLYDTFGRVVDLALREKVRLFVIAGDLFDSNAVSRASVGKVAALIEKLTGAGVEVCISPGTHDSYGRSSVYAMPPLPAIEGVTIFKSEELRPAHFPGLDCTVYGNANMRPFTNKHPLAGFKPDGGGRWRVGMLHASFEVPDLIDDTYVVAPPEIDASGLDYLALGHIHSMSDRSRGKTRAFYCGSPEMVRVQKGDFGRVLLVDAGDTVVVTPFEVGRRKYEELSVRAEGLRSAPNLVSILERHADSDKILKVTVEGVRGIEYPDIEEVAAELGELFFQLSIEDVSIPSAQVVDPRSYPAGSPSAAYLGILESKLEAAPESEKDDILEAMRVGVSLLREGCAQ